MVSETSAYAEEGTAAHEVLEICLREERSPEELVDRVMKNGVVVTGDMAEAVEEAILIIASWRRELVDGGELFLETRVEAVPKNAGTADVGIYGLSKEHGWVLICADYKHGRGVEVEAVVDDEINDQIGYYLIGLALKLGRPIDLARGVVIQPRSPGATEKGFEIDGLELAAWTAGLRRDAEATKDPFAPLRAGPWCRKTWCPASATCEARRALAASQVHRKAVYDDVDVERMDEAAFLEVLELADEIIRDLVPWAKEVLAVGQKFIERGGTLPGWVIDVGRSSRAWCVEEDVVLEVLDFAGIPRDLSEPRKLVSVAQAEKLLKKEKGALKDLFETRTGAPRLVRAEKAKAPLATDRRSQILKGMKDNDD